MAPARRAVIALGGNALARSGEHSTVFEQFSHARESLAPIVALALDGWELCIVHGNGPQVGDELLRNELARDKASPLPLGVLVAATAGWIGYMIQQSLGNALRVAHSPRQVATVVTQVQIDPTDPAFARPTKFVGGPLDPADTRRIEQEGHQVARDGHGVFRRIVPSPPPLAIRELGVITSLIREGTIVIACGGGGVPVYEHPTLGLEGIDAVVDKDLAAAVLAEAIDASLLVILTDVDAVYADWGTPRQRALDRLSIDEAASMDAAGAFGEGSMAPKVRAAVRFVRKTRGRAIITALARGAEAIAGRAGTTILSKSESV